MAGTELDVSAPAQRSGLDIPFTTVVDLVLRRTMADDTTSIYRLSRSLGLSTGIIGDAFEELRAKKLLDVKSLSGNDYTFALTTVGREEARYRSEGCQYAGIAPVSLDTYTRAVALQRVSVTVNRRSIRDAFADLVVEDDMLDQLGPAFNSQHSVFFYGPAGTGKTSLAERLARLYTDWVIIPHAVMVDGHTVIIYDPIVHEALAEQPASLDPRWVACRRPLVVAGGELEASALSLMFDPMSKVYTAPLQVKANNGMFLIDDLGRQLMTPEQLLNRWIYPLSRRIDFLQLVNGTKFAMPFELMVAFSTNMDPDDLGDEAFFRRIKNKVYVGPVTEEAFDRIVNLATDRTGIALTPETHSAMKRICRTRDPIGLRANYPWDLASMAKSICEYEERPPVLDVYVLNRAANIYWGGETAKVTPEHPRHAERVTNASPTAQQLASLLRP